MIINLTDALAARGVDLEVHLETLEAEKRELEAIGLRHPFWSEKKRAEKEQPDKGEMDE